MSRCAMKGDYNVGCGGPFDSSSLFLYLNFFFNSESLLVDELVGGRHAIVIGFDEADKVKIVKCWNPTQVCLCLTGLNLCYLIIVLLPLQENNDFNVSNMRVFYNDRLTHLKVLYN